MTNLRQKIEQDLGSSLEGAWGLPVELIAPDGTRINTSQNDGDTLVGQVLYDTIRVNPDTGEEMVVNNPVVTLRRSSLSQVPAPGEIWGVRIPINPDPEADFEDFLLDKSRPPEGGRSIGFIRLYLRKAVQS